jgi:hypothetical protein
MQKPLEKSSIQYYVANVTSGLKRRSYVDPHGPRTRIYSELTEKLSKRPNINPNFLNVGLVGGETHKIGSPL